MTFLRYFIPLTTEASNRGIKSRYFIHPTTKYNSPLREENYSILSEYSKIYNFEIFEASEAKDFEGTFFMIEGCGIEFLGDQHEKLSITYMTDFHALYPRYIDQVDKVIFPSEHIADYYERTGPKNLYLGSPKYDIELLEDKILEKYNIPDPNNVLFVMPKAREGDTNECWLTVQRMSQACRRLGLRALYKTREKDRYLFPNGWAEQICNFMYFEDESWHPHTTMELIKASKLVINFGSTTIKECVMLNTPVINFDIKPQKRHGRDFGKYRLGVSYLYDRDYCYNADMSIGVPAASIAMSELITNNWSDEFSETRKKYLFEGNSSERILDYLEKS